MSTTAWAAIELFVFALDAAGIIWYLNKMLADGKTPYLKIMIGGTVIFAHLALGYFLSVQDTVRIPVGAVALALYAWLVYRKPIGQTVFHSVLAILVLGLSDALLIFIVTLFPGVSINMATGPTHYRLCIMVVSKFLYAFLLFTLSASTSTANRGASYWGIAIFPPAISMVILAALIEYGISMNASGEWELTSIVAGILVINAVILALHGRITRNSRLLAEQEKMLQQAQLQNIYFNEALTASDNLRGFRHDLRNHLQVLNGLLEMNNVEKAKSYLSEIGNFVNASDVTVNCGHPMIDAVLGSKVALAKKLDIDIVHTVSIRREIGMEPMDLCSILGNIMDNAIEACTHITDAGIRRIEVCIHDLTGDLQVFVSNTMGRSQPGKRKFPFLKDGGEHGIGLYHVKKTVQKYSGVMETDKAKNLYKVKILIPQGNERA